MRHLAASVGFEGKRLWLVPAVLVILALGLALTAWRFIFGLGWVTALNDYQPWGLWVGFDVICGVALAAGGFVLTGIVHLLNFERYKSIVRPAVLTAFLGYILVAVGLLYDLGKPWNIWHPMVMWNPNSVMFEVAWCVMLYLAVLALEFSPALFEKLNLEFSPALREKLALDKILRLLQTLTIPLVIAGILLSTLHQSSLGSLFLIVPQKLHPFWYSNLLPLHFFLSAVTVGFAMVILESFISSRWFRKGLETHILLDLGQLMALSLIITLAVRFQDLWAKGVLSTVFENKLENWALLGKTALFLLPLVLIVTFRNRMRTAVLFYSAASAVAAVVFNRLNVSVIGLARSGNFSYFPSWQEFAVSLFLVTCGFLIFIVCAKYLPVFPAGDPEKCPAKWKSPKQRNKCPTILERYTQCQKKCWWLVFSFPP